MPGKRCQPNSGLEGRATWAVWLENVSQAGWLLNEQVVLRSGGTDQGWPAFWYSIPSASLSDVKVVQSNP